MEKVPESPNLPTIFPKPEDFKGTSQLLKTLIRALFITLRGHALRINRAFMADGSEEMTGPLFLTRVPVADIGAAVGFAGAIIYVPDSSNGSIIAYSDGVNWMELGVVGVVS